MPDINIDMKAGRRIMQRMEQLSDFKDMIGGMHLAYFSHYLSKHMGIDTGDTFDAPYEKARKNAQPFIDEHLDVWVAIVRIIETQFICLASAFAAAQQNATTDIEKNITKCDAFNVFVNVPAMAMVVADDMMVHDVAGINNVRTLNDTFGSSLSLATIQNVTITAFDKTMMNFLKNAIIEGYK